MATKMKRLTLHLRTFLLVIWTLARGGDGYSCPYGQSCGFEPAPPGRTPPCAQPGLTYCVYTDPYPEEIIRKLIENGRYDISTLLSDESRDDFDSRKGDYPYGYGPNSLPHVDQISLVNDVFPKNYNTKFNTRYNHDIYSQKTPLQPPSSVDPSPYNINAYQSSQNFSKFGFHGYQTSPGYWSPNQFDNYDKKVFRQDISPNLGVYNQNFFDTPNLYPNYDTTGWFRQASNGVTQYNPNEWWKYISPARSDVTVQRSVAYPTRSTSQRHSRRRRNAELVKAASKRPLSGAEALRIALGLASAETSAERPRRQTGVTQELCRATTEFVPPRAGLNNKGSWRYIVNMPDNMTQLVRATKCQANNDGCNGICSLPLGYTSRCEQKYIQKRLVALGPSGDSLYTDLFWIPSCCQCTIISNN
ncbi:protein spaetzle 5-like [Pectinophora gossypiella]|uniref:protein spaetzle 5-like n=1 Tax=Pectinophora gossypiella TaxID=13191 RepID=UPI00214F2F8A|nr:protein spaetzle 5-like [Pectinophora gossypiella]XP_049866408.1 protein spaetzle 5-like [Pectinophora gossypiella]